MGVFHSSLFSKILGIKGGDICENCENRPSAKVSSCKRLYAYGISYITISGFAWASYPGVYTVYIYGCLICDDVVTFSVVTYVLYCMLAWDQAINSSEF